MKNYRPTLADRTGTALLAVMLITAVLAILVSSVLSYTTNERRNNERSRLELRARTMAENISQYGSAQIKPILQKTANLTARRFTTSGGVGTIDLPPTSIQDSTFTDTNVGMEVWAGLRSPTPYILINDSTSPNNGLQVATAEVPIIAKATATHGSLGSVSKYVEQQMEMSITPLFQFGMFYNMDMELYPSAAFTVTGPVHTNNRLLAHSDGNSGAVITFTGRVTAAEDVVADHTLKVVSRGSTYGANPPVANSGEIRFRNNAGVYTSLRDNAAGNWRDSRWRTTTYPPTASADTNFFTWSDTTYQGYLRTRVHGVSKLELPVIGTYNEVDDPATTLEDERNNGRQIIDPPNPNKFIAGAWTATTDSADLKSTKLSYKAGLYIVVNPDNDNENAATGGSPARTATLPDGSTVNILPGTYRCWLNTLDSSGNSTMREVVLPGQPSYGYHNANTPTVITDDRMIPNTLPNRPVLQQLAVFPGPAAGVPSVQDTYHIRPTSVGSNQVLRIGHSQAVPGGAATLLANMPNAATTRPLTDLYFLTTTPAGARPWSAPNTGYNLTNGVTPNLNPTFPVDTNANPFPADAYFYDLRRADMNDGFPVGRSTSNPYRPRPIAKIDLDMARLKMMVARVINAATSVSGYDLNAPTAPAAIYSSGVWSASILNPNAAPTLLGLGTYTGTTQTAGALPAAHTAATLSSFNVFPGAGTPTAPDPFQLYYAPLTAAEQAAALADPRTQAVSSSALQAAWFDGIAIYIHSVDAERRSQIINTAGANVNQRLDSGVRLWNGRGPVASMASPRTGCTVITNDAVYIVGHYNADGTINSTTTATGVGGYSSTYPDSNSEMLCSVLGDSVVTLAQPTWTAANSGQTGGWNDTMSAFACNSLTNTDWRTTVSNSNQDGLNLSATATITPSVFSNERINNFVSGTAQRQRLPAVDTEISTALLIGIVPSNHNAVGLTDRAPRSGPNGINSGGANNFPRLLDDWGPGGVKKNLYIRGSMVGMFESRVAMEPFTNSRCYIAPNRLWGLHDGFSQPNHHVPLEPKVIGARVKSFREIPLTNGVNGYNEIKADILALPAL